MVAQPNPLKGCGLRSALVKRFTKEAGRGLWMVSSAFVGFACLMDRAV